MKNGMVTFLLTAAALSSAIPRAQALSDSLYPKLEACMAKLRPGSECVNQSAPAMDLPDETTALFSRDYSQSASLWIDKSPQGDSEGVYTFTDAGIFFHVFHDPELMFHGSRGDEDHGMPRMFSLYVPFSRDTRAEMKFLWSSLRLAVPGTMNANGTIRRQENSNFFLSLVSFKFPVTSRRK